MQTIEKISRHDPIKKEIIINFEYNEKDIENDIKKYSDNYNLIQKDNNEDIEYDTRSVHCRSNDIEKIEKDVVELVEVFNTVQNMVAQQKDTINTIESNIDSASEYVVIAQDDLDEIQKIQEKIINKKTLMYSLGIICISIPIGALVGPIAGVSFVALGVSGLKGYSMYNKNL